jgi:hypothetical protein
MAIAVTKPTPNPDYIDGNKKVRVRTLTFSGNYATGGESFTPTNAGMKQFDQVIVHGGVAAAADMATAIPVFYNFATQKFTFYEGSTAGTALGEKTNAEAYPTGCLVRVTLIGN